MERQDEIPTYCIETFLCLGPKDELIGRGHILNTLLDHLYDLYTSMKSPKEIWNALEAKYKTEKVVERVIDLDLKGC